MNDETLSANELIHALKHGGRTPDIDLIRICHKYLSKSYQAWSK